MKYLNTQTKTITLKEVFKVIFYDVDFVVDVVYKDAPTETYDWTDCEDIVDKRKQLFNLGLAKQLMLKH